MNQTSETTREAAEPVRPLDGLGPLASHWMMIRTGGGRRDMLEWQRKLYGRFGPVHTQWNGPFKLHVLLGPEANRFVLMNKEGLFSSRKPWMLLIGKIFPNGLMLRDGEDHKLHRRIMQGAFLNEALRDYTGRMNPMVEQGIGAFESNGRPTLAFGAFKKLTLNMAATIFIGEELGPGSERMNTAFEDMVAASMSRIKLPVPGLEFQRGLAGRKFMIDFFRRRMSARRASESSDMFSRLCHAKGEGGEAFSDPEVIDHMIFLMMAAHDTTTSTLTSMTWELSRNPQWQERLREESRALGDGPLTVEDLDRLPGMMLVMKETLRRYPPLPVIPRWALREFEWEGRRIPADTMVAVSPIFTHHMEQYWTEPFRFDPERFAPGRAEQDQHSHLWAPFGGGAHTCLGMRFAEIQVRMIMHRLILRYRWQAPEGYEMPVQQAPISKPTDGLPMRFERISGSGKS